MVQGVEGVWPDKNDPKCNMGFDSLSFSKKKMLRTAEKLKFGQKQGKKKDGVQGVQNSKGVDKNVAKCNIWCSGVQLKST